MIELADWLSKTPLSHFLQTSGWAVPGRARLAGALSLALWLAVIVAGRLIGFTTTGANTDRGPEPAAAAVDFEEFLSNDAAAAPAAAP